jgi:alginate O-acetyltransferase complex protein AlgI
LKRSTVAGSQIGAELHRRADIWRPVPYRGNDTMVFSSITFLFFFLPTFVAVYFLTPTIWGKNLITLLFSLVFYAWGEPKFVLILLASIAFNMVAAIIIDKLSGRSRK